MRRTPFSCSRWSKKSALVKAIGSSVRSSFASSPCREVAKRFGARLHSGLPRQTSAETYRVPICLPNGSR
jgi:hypothetical protein